jgi:hypothetical protein
MILNFVTHMLSHEVIKYDEVSVIVTSPDDMYYNILLHT